MPFKINSIVHLCLVQGLLSFIQQLSMYTETDPKNFSVFWGAVCRTEYLGHKSQEK